MESSENAKQQIQVTVDAHQITTDEREKAHGLSVTKALQSPIFTRLHAGHFRISLSLASQALLWKTLSSANSNIAWHVHSKLPYTAFLLLWGSGLLAQVCLSLLYILKCVLNFDAIKAEFSHYVGVNYMYAPWISWLLLLQSAPRIAPTDVVYQVFCGLLTLPILALDVKIYGQWFTTEKRFLSVMANPTSQVSAIANMVAARAAVQTGWRESAVCFFSLGLVHYLVIFVTLYQRLSGVNSFPATLRPAFFLFFAAPGMASLSWSTISGAFDVPTKMLFFISLFIFTSLACRPTLFKKSMRKFNVAWWAYSFPLTFLALASVEYAREVKHHFAAGLMLLLTVVSVLVFLAVLMLTAANSDRLLQDSDPAVNSAIILRREPELSGKRVRKS